MRRVADNPVPKWSLGTRNNKAHIFNQGGTRVVLSNR
jgi:hypothetical protein